jgi:hypothetical protein
MRSDDEHRTQREKVAEMLAKNKSVTHIDRFADPATPWGGGHTIHFKTAAEAAAYDKYPLGNAARVFGLTIDEYIDWIETMGTPMCGARTAKDRPCGKAAGRMQMMAADWKREHRNARCALHRRERELER